ncbi:MAG TPA: SRPBCC family protein [Nonomuraea sp.]|nr:SRPBCC family protein [Nonomuraea sp.]
MTEATKTAVRQGQEAVQQTPAGKAMPELPTAQLTAALQDLAVAVAERALSSVIGKVEGMSGRLTDYAEGGGSNLLGAIIPKGDSGKSIGGSAITGAAKGALKGAFGALFKRGKGSGAKTLKVTNIVESIDIGAPRRVVYNQWTLFRDFPTFMKKIENVDQESDEKLAWKAQIFWSHRAWRSTILEQVPDERIMWRSEGDKGYVDGAVSFHEILPDLTRVIVVLEYHPKGLFEHTGNLWRAQGRRVRLELKHFARHVMSHVMLHPDEVAKSGWRGEIHEGEVTATGEEAGAAEPGETPEEAPEKGREEGRAEGAEEAPSAEHAEEEPEEEPEAAGEEEQQPEAEYEAAGEEEEPEAEEAEYEGEEEEEPETAEYEEEEEEAEEEPEAEYEEEEEEHPPARRQPIRAGHGTPTGRRRAEESHESARPVRRRAPR